MSRFASHIKRKILIIFFFLAFFTHSYAETVSTDEVITTRKTITEDLTITSSGRVHCEDVTQCVKANADNLTIINRGTLSNDDTDGSDLDILITANGDALDIKIYNYGTMEVDGNAAIFIPNNDELKDLFKFDISRSKAIETATQTLENVHGANLIDYRVSTNNWYILITFGIPISKRSGSAHNSLI